MNKGENNSPVPRNVGVFLLMILKRIYQTRKWWLIPLWILLVTVAIVLFLSGNGVLLPAIYIAL